MWRHSFRNQLCRLALVALAWTTTLAPAHAGATSGGRSGGAAPRAQPVQGQPPVAPVLPIPSDGLSAGRRESEGPASDPLDDRLLPDAARSPWRSWFSRNFHRFEPPPLADGAGRGGLPPHLLDPRLRAERAESYRGDVAARLSLLLRDGDDRVRGAAALSLARGGFIRTGQDADRLLQLADDDQRRVRSQALLAAALGPASPARHRLLRIAHADFDGLHLQNEVERDRVRALASLFLSLANEPALPLLVRDFASDLRKPLQLRALVVQALGLCGAPTALPLLADLLAQVEQPPLIRATAAAALGQLADPLAAPLLLARLEQRDSDTDVRAAAALALGAVAPRGDEEFVRALLKATERESNAHVSRFLLLSLGEIGGATARLRLERALEHESAEQRVFAELGLGMLARQGERDRWITPLLDALRRTRSQDEQCALLCALGISGAFEAYQSVAEFLAAGAPEVRRAAISALSLLGQPGAVASFERLLLDDPAPEVRMHAARALGRLDPSCAALLVHELGGGRSRAAAERAALILAIGFTRDPVALEPLLELLREPDPTSREREAAAQALGLIYDEQRLAPTARLASARSLLQESTELAELLTLVE